MNIKIGEKIRTLRKQKSISQEILAQALGVTFQAVSKWENETAMPDVTLIPAIASFFGISTDELFDFNLMEQEKMVMDIVALAGKYRGINNAEAERILREGLERYPGNDVLLNNLVYVIPIPERSSEVIDICKAVVATTRYDDVKHDVHRIMAEAYKSIGEYAMVKAAIEQIPEIYFTKLEVAAALLEGEDIFTPANEQKNISAETLIKMLMRLADYYEWNNENGKAVVQLTIAKRIIEAFKDDFNTPGFKGPVYEYQSDNLKVIEKRLEKLK